MSGVDTWLSTTASAAMNLLAALLRLRLRRNTRRARRPASTDYADLGTAFGLDAVLDARGDDSAPGFPSPPRAAADAAGDAKSGSRDLN